MTFDGCPVGSSRRVGVQSVEESVSSRSKVKLARDNVFEAVWKVGKGMLVVRPFQNYNYCQTFSEL